MIKTLKQTLRRLNWEKNFLVKRLKLRMLFALMGTAKWIMRPRSRSVDLSSARKILVVRNDRIGDMIATTALIRNLVKAGYQVHLSSRKAALDIIAHHPGVSGTFVYDDSSVGAWLRSLRAVREEKFDLAVDVRCNRFVDIPNLLFCSFIRTPILAGFNKSSVPTFNVAIPYYAPESHVTVQLRTLLEHLGVAADDLHYELHVSADTRARARSFIDALRAGSPKKVAIFNAFGSVPARFLSDEQIGIVCRQLQPDYQIVLIGEPERLQALRGLADVTVFESRSVLDVAPLIELSDLVVSVDTAIVHMASCYRRNTVAFYINTVPVAPVTTDIKILRSHEIFLLNSKLQDYYQDARYLKKVGPDRTIPVNHLVWAPHNPNARQIVFASDPIRKVAAAVFEAELAAALRSLDASADVATSAAATLRS